MNSLLHGHDQANVPDMAQQALTLLKHIPLHESFLKLPNADSDLDGLWILPRWAKMVMIGIPLSMRCVTKPKVVP